MGNKKKPNGVVATIERLTGQTPCPEHLRSCLNKYLYVDGLFQGGRSRPPKELGRLEAGKTDALVLNVLSLDIVFAGDTQLVARILRGEVEGPELSESLTSAEGDLNRRYEAYGYWVLRMKQLRSVLLHEERPDLRTVRLHEYIKSPDPQTGVAHNSPFALRAVQQLERSEAKGRIGGASASDLVDQADAYFTLGDLARAATKAEEAIALEPQNAHAWFIRVMAALRLRNEALQHVQSYQIEADEIGLPLTGHEHWVAERRNEFLEIARRQDELLMEILPNALLNWPRAAPRSAAYEHGREWRLVRDQFIDAVFTKVCGCDFPHCYARNGLDAELQNVLAGRGSATRLIGNVSPSRDSPLNDKETAALRLMLDEWDNPLNQPLSRLDRNHHGRNFKLFHLRWALALGGEGAHWSRLNELLNGPGVNPLIEASPANPEVERLLVAHSVRNNGLDAHIAMLENGRNKAVNEYQATLDFKCLRQFGLLFHHFWVRREYKNCIEVAQRANDLATVKSGYLDCDRDGMDHPDHDGLWWPLRSRPYWQYLKVLATLGGMQAGVEGIDGSVLRDCEALMAEFEDVDVYSWRLGDVDEPEDLRIAPYRIDLRFPDFWLAAVRSYLDATPKPCELDELSGLESRLAALPREDDLFHNSDMRFAGLPQEGGVFQKSEN
ncbi:hypothetical protein [Niveibacterium terrae]|uniref:hypothetical protein n=1 Tax=Niveibacterium terrae TaxID=3373598 RepID=UPI003A8E48D5